MDEKQKERAQCLIKTMDWDYLSELQLEMVESFESQLEKRGYLSDRQIEVLENINKQASERDKPYRR